MANIKSFPNNQDEYIGAEEVMKWLHGRTSGVFAANSNAATAAVANTMAVTVSDGVGWITDASGDGIVWWNDTEKTSGSKLQLSISAADSVLDRIDRVVVTWTTTNYAALPTIEILKGTAASTATAPALTNNTTTRQLSLARISVKAGTTSITNSMITDERLDASVCGLVTESVKLDTTTVNNQFLALLDEFNTKLAELKEQITQAASQTLIDESVTTAKIAANAVTRAKLATDALYSPVVQLTADRDITADDLGKTLYAAYNSTANTITLNLTQDISGTLPAGFEIAVSQLWYSNKTAVAFTGVRVYANGELAAIASKTSAATVTVPSRGEMMALKKMEHTPSSGDVWLLTGSWEVVS